MSRQFFRCAHCRMPHGAHQALCLLPAKRGPPSERDCGIGSIGPSPVFASARDSFIGRTVGDKFVIRRMLGQGGMGKVFEAENVSNGGWVAIKILHPDQVRRKDVVRRFQREARAAAAICHPNVCSAYDLGKLDDGTPYLIMERLSGETLGRRLASGGRLEFEDAVDILIQVLSGLAAAHSKGIVHRDIKPENVFLTRHGAFLVRVKVLDFGVSKTMPKLGVEDSDEIDITRAGMVIGTPHYMAPEQARGERDLDARVDVYACGILLYETLSGRRPFTATSPAALLAQILVSDPRPLRAVRPDLPNGIDAVLGHAIARDRADRYANAADFAAALQAIRVSLARHPRQTKAKDAATK
jgi:eukaryotic-like serine/threonine-protein kinase